VFSDDRGWSNEHARTYVKPARTIAARRNIEITKDRIADKSTKRHMHVDYGHLPFSPLTPFYFIYSYFRTTRSTIKIEISNATDLERYR